MAVPVGLIAALMLSRLMPSDADIALIGPAYVLSHVGGGLLGAPFIPLSLFVAEDPDYCWGG